MGGKGDTSMDLAGDKFAWDTQDKSKLAKSNWFNTDGDGLGKSAPDQHVGAATQGAMTGVQQGANQQLQNNRLNTNNPFASQRFDSDGNVHQDFTGALGDANRSLQQQAGYNSSRPMDWAQFGEVGTGDQARNQAIDSAYSQATSRLDPEWQKREDMNRTRLLNQGLEEGSEAYDGAMSKLGNQRNDAYSSAMNGAIAQGTAAGDSVYRNNMGSRQQAIQEALTARGQPMSELGQLNGLLGNQPQYNADNSTFGASAMAGQMGIQGAQGDVDRRQQAFNNYMTAQGKQQANNASTMQGIGSTAAASAGWVPYLASKSDMRCKRHVYEMGVDVLPGVPWVAFYYREGYGPPGIQMGVVAQDLEAVRPDLVRIDEATGMREVDYPGLRKAVTQ